MMANNFMATIFLAICGRVAVITARPTGPQNSTTIVNAGQDVPVTVNNVIYCNNNAESERGYEWDDVLAKTRKQKGCTRTMYGFPDNDIANYIRVKTPIPKMDHVTVCASFDSGPTGIFSGTLLSYATTTNVNSMIILGEVADDGVNTVNVYINSVGKAFVVNLPPNEMIHMCITFDITKGRTEIFLNGAFKETVGYKHNDPIYGDGVLLIGQEQDMIMNGFDPAQAFIGKIANFMVWDRLLSRGEIETLGRFKCGCIDDYIVSLRPEFVELSGKVVPMVLEACPNTGKSSEL